MGEQYFAGLSHTKGAKDPESLETLSQEQLAEVFAERAIEAIIEQT
jgi:hypothetical protein